MLTIALVVLAALAAVTGLVVVVGAVGTLLPAAVLLMRGDFSRFASK